MDNIWSLYFSDGKPAVPLKYSNGMSQVDVIRKILRLFEYYDIVILRGATGTGKSVIALHVIRNMGRGIISVPFKVLQKQYVNDYQKRFYLLRRKSNSKLKIMFMMGKSNYWCPLHNTIAIDKKIPCNNPEKKNYCPRRMYILSFATQKTKFHVSYSSVGGIKYLNFNDETCPYYSSYFAYKYADAIIMNHAKWTVETILRRKPLTNVEVIDEFDWFLDNLMLNIEISRNDIKKLPEMYERDRLFEVFKYVLENVGERPIELFAFPEFIAALEDLVRMLYLYDTDDKSIMKIFSAGLQILKFRNYIYVSKGKDSLIFSSPFAKNILAELFGNSAGKILLMSATVNKPFVLKTVYGITHYGFIKGEPKMPGTIYILRTDKEFPVTWRNMQDSEKRNKYEQLLEETIRILPKPILIQVPSTSFLNGELAKILKSRKQDKMIKQFLKKEIDVLYSTKLMRGADLRDDLCRSIVILKDPIPDYTQPVFRIFREVFGEQWFWAYVRDLADRFILQSIGRGVRHKNDWVVVWSPDSRCWSRIYDLTKKNASNYRVVYAHDLNKVIPNAG